MLSPLPWKVEQPKSDYGLYAMDRTISATTPAGNPIWVCRVYNQVGGDVDTNADLIVKAVNSHDKLVDALKEALDTLADYHYNSGIDHKSVMSYELGVLAEVTK